MEEFWALRDISFNVARGEVVGIVGRNGAGKSTLLKVLSRITSPTGGVADIYGRVGALLEVGTGFHPELTGRENTYLNGAILGMSRARIREKYDQIVDFAGVEKFMETPVKRYSSGMYTRLAFAVAAFLEPEILVVDEVLSVGDAAFQKRCLGKIGEVAKSGRTVLFVSHQMNAIRRLCDRCIWLDSGQVRMIGPKAQVLAAYDCSHADPLDGAGRDLTINANETRFNGWRLRQPGVTDPHILYTTGPFELEIDVHVAKPIRHGHHGIDLWNAEQERMWGWCTNDVVMAPGQNRFRYRLPYLPLRPGSYLWHVSLYDDGELLDQWHGAPHLIIGAKPLGHPLDEFAGLLNMGCDFQIIEDGADRDFSGPRIAPINGIGPDGLAGVSSEGARGHE